MLSLELSNLKRALDRGQGRVTRPDLRKCATRRPARLDLAPLERYLADRRRRPCRSCKREFRPGHECRHGRRLDPVDGSVIDRLLAGAKSVVRVRKVSHEAGDNSTEAIVARIETALNESRLGDVVAQAKALPQHARRRRLKIG